MSDKVEEVQEDNRCSTITLFGNLDSESTSKVRGMVLQDFEIKGIRAFEFHVGTGGGAMASAQGLTDYIRTLHDIKGTVILSGLCCSAGWNFLTLGLTTLAYPNTLFMNHSGSYEVNGTAKVIANNTLGYERASAEADQLLIDKAGLNKKEYEELHCSGEKYFLGIDALWYGTQGLVDGLIMKDLGSTGWIVLTREGLKYWSSGLNNKLSERKILSDEQLEEYGLKQYVPTRPKQPKPQPSGNDLVTFKS